MSKIRVFAFLSALALLLGAYGCRGGGDGGAAKVVIVTTDALYEIASAVGAGRIEVTNLLSGGAEIHNFEPAVSDAKALADASFIIYNGLGLDDWAAELGGEKAFAVTSLMSEFIPGDPHVWLSPAYAEAMAGAVCQKLKEFDPAGADIYEENCAVFRGELKALSDEFHPQFAKARLSTFVTGHAALGYLAKEFGLVQKSVSDVFSSSEPTAQQLMELADFCNESGVKYVLSESNAPLAVSETLANECGAQVLPVYMMESAREGGLSFLVRMRHNLETVLKAVT